MSASPETPFGLNTKPGRKPIETEPKNKRTAQNRAAQRAFRERKEKKMQELEMKVKLLENEKLQISNESELLRIQVESLLTELNSVKGNSNYKQAPAPRQMVNMPSSTSNSNSSPLSNFSSSSNATPKSMSDMNSSTSLSTSGSHDINNINGTNWSVPELSNSGSVSSDSSPNNNVNGSLLNDMINTTTFDNALLSSMDNFKDTYDEPVNDFCVKLNGACGSKDSPIPKDYDYSKNPSNLPRDPNGNDISSLLVNQMIPSTTNTTITTPSSISSSNYHNKTSVSSSSVPFMSDNTKGPRQTSFAADSPMNFIYQSPYDNNLLFNNNLSTPATNASSQNQFSSFELFNTSIAQQNNAQKINNNDFNFNLDDEDDDILKQKDYDPIESLLLEEDNKDLFGGNFISQENYNTVEPSTAPIAEPTKLTQGNLTTLNNSLEDDLKVGENENKETLMKCSQVWERITTHPRFSELDIDGLCSELKAKAKCSEKGVVVSGEDVGKVLQTAIINHCGSKNQDGKESNNTEEGKKMVNHFLKGFS